MIYSQLYLKDRFKVPTVLTVLFILVLVIFFARFFTRTSIPSRASGKTVKRVEVVNLSPAQAAVYWQTDIKTTGKIVLGENENRLTQIIGDERDIDSKENSYINHYVIFRNLNEKKRYFFKIISNNQLIDNNGKAFTFVTPGNNQATTNLKPAYGKIIKSNDQPLENAMVLISFDNAYRLAALTKATGEWMIPLIGIPANYEQLKIEVISEDNMTSSIIADLSQLSPTPQTIVIGKDYNFIGTAPNVLSAQSTMGEAKKSVDIIYPKENALIPGRIPLIKGIGLPKSQMSIVINSTKTYSAKVVGDAAGNWSYTPPEDLSLGKHTITVTGKDEKGNNVLVERNFIIIGYEGGDARVMGVATGEPVISGAPTTTLLPTFTPMPTFPLSPTNSTASPSAPISGGSNFIISAIGGLSLIIVGAGIILAF